MWLNVLPDLLNRMKLAQAVQKPTSYFGLLGQVFSSAKCFLRMLIFMVGVSL